MNEVLKKAYKALEKWKSEITVEKFIEDNKRIFKDFPKVQTTSPLIEEVIANDISKRNKYNLTVGQKYIMIGNNKDNISVGTYLGEQEYPNFTMSLFEDVVTKEKCVSMRKHIAFTKKRLLALSSLHYTDVVELMFHQDDAYECNEESMPSEELYIDPMQNYEIIMSAITAGETENV